MNKKFRIIVLVFSCILLVFGTITVKKIKDNNAEVSNQILNTNEDKSNDENIEVVQEHKEFSNDNKAIESDDKDTSTSYIDNAEVASNDFESATNNIGGNGLGSDSGGMNNNSSQPNTDENIPIKPPIPPQVIVPEVPEIPEATFPTVADLKQFMINYGIGLGKIYDPTCIENGFATTTFTETWSPWIGQEGGANQLFSDFHWNRFAIKVVDLGNGFVEFSIYVSDEEYFG